MIDGVEVHDLKLFRDDRGGVMRGVRVDDPFFNQFGEVYFSYVNPGVVKAWHLHKRMELNYICIFQQVRVVLYDGREGSPTHGEVQEVILEGYPFENAESYRLLKIPPLVWNGFRMNGLYQLASESAIVANVASIPHDPDEIVRVHPEECDFPYDWGEYHVAG